MTVDTSRLTGVARRALERVLPPETVDRFLSRCDDHAWSLIAGVAVLFAAVGVVLDTGFYMTVVMDMFLFAVLALSWDLVGGQTGYPSFGNMAFFGLGAYTTAILTEEFAIAFPAAFLAAGLLTVAFAAVIGAAVLRLRGHYFAIATLGVLLATREVTRNLEITGGASGIILLDTPDQQAFYFVFLGVFVLNVATVYYLSGTRMGFVLNAIRDDEQKATAMGFNTTYYKTAAWALAALFTGLIGAAWSLENGFLDPNSAYNDAWNVELIAMAILGGSGTVAGPVVGAFGLHLVIVFVGVYFAGWQLVLLGLAVILAVVLIPDGGLGTLSEYAAAMDYFERGGMAAVDPDSDTTAPDPDADTGDPDGGTTGTGDIGGVSPDE